MRVAGNIVYTVEVDEHSTVAWLLSEVTRTHIKTLGDAATRDSLDGMGLRVARSYCIACVCVLCCVVLCCVVDI